METRVESPEVVLNGQQPETQVGDCGCALPSAAQAGRRLERGTAGSPMREERYTAAWLLWSRRRFILRLAGVGVITGMLLAVIIPSRYTATAQLMPPDAVGGGSMGMAAIASGMADKAGGLGTAAADLLGFKSSGALFVAILGSRTVRQRLVARFDLRRVYGTRYWAQARARLGERTDISEDRKSGVIKVEVTDSDRERARKIAKAYVEELNRVVSMSSMSAAGRERAFLENRMAEVKKEMDDSAVALAEFSSSNNMVDLKEQARAMVDAVSAVQGQRIAAQSELKALQSIYTQDNYRVRAAQAQIAELDRQIKAIEGKAGTVRGDGSEEYPTIRQLPNLGVTYEDLYRRNKIADAVYEALVQQYEMSKIEEAKDTPKVQMLDDPEVPEVKSFPPRLLIVMSSVGLSLLFAAGWVIAAEWWLAIEDEDSGKRLVIEVVRTTRQHRMWHSNGALRVRAISGRVATRFKRLGVRRNGPGETVAAD
jgi:capsule polysaccharide export protein KpsE/RkpR